jgi:hypothetical protein
MQEDFEEALNTLQECQEVYHAAIKPGWIPTITTLQGVTEQRWLDTKKGLTLAGIFMG